MNDFVAEKFFPRYFMIDIKKVLLQRRQKTVEEKIWDTILRSAEAELEDLWQKKHKKNFLLQNLSLTFLKTYQENVLNANIIGTEVDNFL